MKNLSYESWITQFVENLSEYFNLAGWRISLEFSEDQDVSEEGNLVAASISVTSDYQMAVITVSPPLQAEFERGEFRQIVQSLVHEMVHIFLAPLQEHTTPHLSQVTAPLFMKIVEQQTQRLTSVILKNLPDSIMPPRPKKNGKHNSTR